MSRIVIVLHTHLSYHSGGAELQAKFISEYLHDKGHEVIYLCRNARPDPNDPVAVVQVDAVKLPWGGRAPYFFDGPGLWRELTRLQPMAVYQRCGSPYTGIVAAFCRRHGIRMVWHIAHEDDLLPFAQVRKGNLLVAWINHRLLAYGIRHADGIVAQTEDQKRLLLHHHGRDCDAVIANFHPEPPPPSPKKGQDKMVLWVANFKEWKRPEVFMALAAGLATMTSVRFVMVGRLEDTPRVAALRQQAAEVANLTLTGELPLVEVNHLLERASLFVNTSKREGFPNTFIQAWMRATPVVSLDVDPDRVLTEHGLGVCSGSVEQMIKDVRALLENEEGLLAMGARARRYAVATHGLANAALLAALLQSR